MKTHVLLAALILAGCSKGAKDEDAPAPVALVRTAPAQTAVLTQTLETYGQAEITPSAERTVAAPADSVVRELDVAVGDRVRAGQTLAKLGPTANARIDLDRAQRDEAAAEAAYARVQRLRAAGLASDADVETARAAAGTATETARSLRARSADIVALTAPIAGVVEALQAAPGETVATGAGVLKIGDPLALRARLGLEPAQAATVRAGAGVRLSSLQGQAQTTTSVVSIDPRADPQTRQVSAILRLPTGAGFSPGEAVRGDIALQRRTAMAVAPREALLYDGDHPYLFVTSGGTAHKRDVTLGIEQADQVEVRSGLAAGERVVIEGGGALSDGMAVREQAGAKAAPEKSAP